MTKSPRDHYNFNKNKFGNKRGDPLEEFKSKLTQK